MSRPAAARGYRAKFRGGWNSWSLQVPSFLLTSPLRSRIALNYLRIERRTGFPTDATTNPQPIRRHRTVPFVILGRGSDWTYLPRDRIKGAEDNHFAPWCN